MDGPRADSHHGRQRGRQATLAGSSQVLPLTVRNREANQSLIGQLRTVTVPICLLRNGHLQPPRVAHQNADAGALFGPCRSPLSGLHVKDMGASRQLKQLVDVSRDCRCGGLSQNASKSTRYEIGPSLLMAQFIPETTLSCPELWTGLATTTKFSALFSTWLRTITRWMASFAIMVPATSMPVLETRNVDGTRYWVACFECMRKYIAP
jgi:hypothetical protein